jgi:catechol 2,3-dioxygenase-like lactoylglutathione lyase family enzyme
MAEYPQLLHTAIDTTDARALAEFYRQLLGLRYRYGDEPPADGAPDDADWLVLVDPSGNRKLAFQQVERLEQTTWPEHEVPMQMHVDFTVPSLAELRRHRERAEALGPGRCWTGQMNRTSPCTSSPIPQAIRSASSSPDAIAATVARLQGGCYKRAGLARDHVHGARRRSCSRTSGGCAPLTA